MNVPARCMAVIFSAGVAILVAVEAPGASLTWQVSSGNWSVASNWSGTVLPTAGDTAYIVNGDTASIGGNQPGAMTGTLSLGSSNSGNGSVLMTSGSLATANFEYIGDSGIGSFVQSGGTNLVSTSGVLYLGKILLAVAEPMP